MCDAIELHLLKEENKLETIEEITYQDVFPEDKEFDPNSFDGIMERLLQEFPEADINELFEKAQERANRNK